VVLLDISAKRQPVNGEFINDYDDMCMSWEINSETGAMKKGVTWKRHGSSKPSIRNVVEMSKMNCSNKHAPNCSIWVSLIWKSWEILGEMGRFKVTWWAYHMKEQTCNTIHIPFLLISIHQIYIYEKLTFSVLQKYRDLSNLWNYRGILIEHY
jgi:hypothetical protein